MLLGGFVFCCLALVYITVKPYPMTLNEEGALIVDPQKMMNDGYGDLGMRDGITDAGNTAAKIFDEAMCLMKLK